MVMVDGGKHKNCIFHKLFTLDMLYKMVSPVTCEAAHEPSYICPRANAELVEDQLMVLLDRETAYTVPHTPCRASIVDPDRLPYDEWRRKICQWSFKVIDHFRLDREVVSCAMNIFDRYLARMPKSFDMETCDCPACQRSVDSRTFQLTAMTSLYLAMKLNSDNGDNESSCRKLRLISFVELSRGQFCADDICEMETTILKELRWQVHPTTPMTCVSYLLRLMPPATSIPWPARKSYDLVLHVLHELARYLTELSVCLGSTCSAHTPSQIAYASIMVSMDLLTYPALPLQVRRYFNEAVVSLSSRSGGTILTPHDEIILYLQEKLRQSFWPEMLMDDRESSETGHPISMARDFGLLDISSLSSTPYYAPNRTSVKENWEGSPICVSR
jgi:hypothetical protein